MAKPKKVDEAKVVAWTDGIRISFDGSISACTLELFNCIRGGDKRDMILRLMNEQNEKLKQKGY